MQLCSLRGADLMQVLSAHPRLNCMADLVTAVDLYTCIIVYRSRTFKTYNALSLDQQNKHHRNGYE